MTTTQVAERSRIAAIVLAGGLGNRMGDSIDVPKQFYLLNGKPILIHTLEVFERHPEVDIVCVVCLAGREEYLRESLERFGIRKVGPIVTAGEVRQGSVYNGLKALEGVCRPDDIVIVHDGVRMFIFPELITEIINAVKQHGPSMTSIRNSDSLLISSDGVTSRQALNRDQVYMVQTPQSYRYGQGMELYEKAYREGITSSINCCELFVHYEQEVHLVPGLKTNIKITTAEDINFFHALHAIYSGL